MTPEDFRSLIAILSTADGDCSYCFDDLLEKCYKRFPDWPWDRLPEASTDWTPDRLTRILENLRAGRRLDS